MTSRNIGLQWVAHRPLNRWCNSASHGSVRDGGAMIANGFRTVQNIGATSLDQGCQRLTHFSVIMEAFSKPDGSWMGRE